MKNASFFYDFFTNKCYAKCRLALILLAGNPLIYKFTLEKERRMPYEENKEFIRRYLDAINGKPKPDSVLRLFIAEQPLIDHIQVAEVAFPLYRIDVEEMMAEGDMVSLRGKIRGVQNGPFMNMPPSGKPVDFAIFITYKVQSGKIVDHWMLTDDMAMLKQVGALPAPA